MNSFNIKFSCFPLLRVGEGFRVRYDVKQDILLFKLHGILYSMYVDKSPADIIEMHNPPTSNWEVVADDLGITQEELDEIHQKMEILDLGMIKGPKGPGAMRF